MEYYTEISFYSNDKEATAKMRKDFDVLFSACEKDKAGRVSLDDVARVYFPQSASKIYKGGSDAKTCAAAELKEDGSEGLWTKNFRTYGFNVTSYECGSLSAPAVGIFAGLIKRYYPDVQMAYFATPRLATGDAYEVWDPDNVIVRHSGDRHMDVSDSKLMESNYKYRNGRYGDRYSGYGFSSYEDLQNLLSPAYEMEGREGESLGDYARRAEEEGKIKITRVMALNPYTEFRFKEDSNVEQSLPEMSDDSTPTKIISDFVQKSKNRSNDNARYRSK